MEERGREEGRKREGGRRERGRQGWREWMRKREQEGRRK
jgi:hypothetical protein